MRCSTRSRRGAGRGTGLRGYAGIAANLEHTLDLKLRADRCRARNREKCHLHGARAGGPRAAEAGANRPARRPFGVTDPRLDRGARRRRSRCAGAGDRRSARLRLRSPRSCSRISRLTENDLIPDRSGRGGWRGRGTEEENSPATRMAGESSQSEGQTRRARRNGRIPTRGEASSNSPTRWRMATAIRRRRR